MAPGCPHAFTYPPSLAGRRGVPTLDRWVGGGEGHYHDGGGEGGGAGSLAVHRCGNAHCLLQHMLPVVKTDLDAHPLPRHALHRHWQHSRPQVAELKHVNNSADRQAHWLLRVTLLLIFFHLPSENWSLRVSQNKGISDRINFQRRSTKTKEKRKSMLICRDI